MLNAFKQLIEGKTYRNSDTGRHLEGETPALNDRDDAYLQQAAADEEELERLYGDDPQSYRNNLAAGLNWIKPDVPDELDDDEAEYLDANVNDKEEQVCVPIDDETQINKVLEFAADNGLNITLQAFMSDVDDGDPENGPGRGPIYTNVFCGPRKDIDLITNMFNFVDPYGYDEANPLIRTYDELSKSASEYTDVPFKDITDEYRQAGLQAEATLFNMAASYLAD